MIRVFIALKIPEPVLREIGKVQGDLKRLGGSIKWVRPASMHITLKFLGDVDEPRVDDLAGTLQLACQSQPSFELGLDGTGTFPDRRSRSPRVLWVGLNQGREAVTRLAGVVETACGELGFPREKRPFSPHLTLARVKVPHGVQPVVEALMNTRMPPMTFHVSNVLIMKSDLKPTGAVYTALHSIPLEG